MKEKTIGLTIILIFIMLFLFIFTGGCWSSGNLEYVKDRACDKWQELGFECVGYEGYNWGYWGRFGSKYGGAYVWHIVKKIPDNGVIYTGCMQRWGDEIHMYNFKPIDGFRIETK